MRNFKVSTTFDGRGWHYIIHGLPCVGWAPRRQDVRSDAQLFAALWLDVQPNSVNIGRVRYLGMHWSRLEPDLSVPDVGGPRDDGASRIVEPLPGGTG